MTFWEVTWAVVVGNFFTAILSYLIFLFTAWKPKPRGPRPGGPATAKEVQMAWDKAISDDPDHVDDLIRSDLQRLDHTFYEGELEE